MPSPIMRSTIGENEQDYMMKKQMSLQSAMVWMYDDRAGTA